MVEYWLEKYCNGKSIGLRNIVMVEYWLEKYCNGRVLAGEIL
jgi:hypothetical protein